MPHINLLAWRDASRKEAQKQFVTILVLVVIVAFGSMFALSMFYGALKDGQNVRNNFLTSEIALLDQRIKDINELDKRKASLQQRMRLIEELQSNRNLGTQIMDEVALVVPSGVYLTSLERRDRALQIVGKSESHNRVSAMLRKLEESYLFEDAIMQVIEAGDQELRLLNDFNLRFRVKPFEEISEVQK
ncbi:MULTISPECIES: PilN domain-containing protein [Pseudoalteromonas]|jgi:type IV pilus assembly protein PilN|uniref:PilN domain-containing protein n=1 Tax=Pseudoalteromonas TaxID=53246 RepID=UPI0006D60A75|nr:MULTISPECIES: PilN domain-containing protein [unclassified Pseudoalteromonas]KPV94139.1 Fimbrial assembly protein (PilN) [Pseudoalteromonas sp. P1-9]MCF6459010.1 PilN domain-containing protein [Pseudoalteromonas sp. MMG024]